MWYADCAFGCGAVLTYNTATIDRYPTPGRCGGTYHIDNTRLACQPCNSNDGGSYSHGEPRLSRGMTKQDKKKWKRALKYADTTHLTPEQVLGYRASRSEAWLHGIDPRLW